MELITVSRYFDLTEAQVARGALRSGHVDELLRDEHLASIDWSYLIALGGLRLEAQESAESEAMLSREFSLAETCPELESYEAPNWRRVRLSKWITIVVWISPVTVAVLLEKLFGGP